MELDKAKELLHLFARIGGYLNQSVAFVQDCDDEARFLEYRSRVAGLMAGVFDEGMQPIYKRFPELLPDYLGGSYEIPQDVYFPLFYDVALRNPTDQCNEEEAESGPRE